MLDRSQIDWARKQGYKYVHLGAIRLGLNPLVRPFLNVSSLCVAVDTCHKHFANAIIGGFAAPLHDGPAFGIIYPKFSVSLFDPHIYELLKAYVLPQGFSMMDGSHIIQLKAVVIVHFENDTLPPLQSPVHNTPRLLSVVEKDISRKAQPVLFDWRGIQYPQEWECKYDELRNAEALQASLRSQPITFDRQNSSFRMPNITPFPRFSLADVNPPLNRSISTSSSVSVDRRLSSTPSAPEINPSESFTGLQDTEHRGQHTDCPACHKTLEKLR